MKRLLFFFFTIVMVSSCFGDEYGDKQTISGVVDFQFENLTYKNDSTTFITTTPEGFSYSIFNFYHKLDAGQTTVDGGFMISRLEMPRSGNTAGLENTYRSYIPGTKMDYLNVYIVYRQNQDPALMPQHDFHFPMASTGTCKLSGLFVSNTVEVVDSVKANFQEGDKLTLKAIGYNAGVKTGEVAINLAEYTAQKDSIVSKWTPFSLSALGAVEFVDFEITSTNPDVPTYFCMDNMVYEAELQY